MATLTLTLALAAPAVAYSPITPGTATITGNGVVGGTLVVESTGWDPADAELSYQWWQSSIPLAEATDYDATPIEGADTEQLTLTPDLFGAYVWVEITGSAYGLDPATTTAGGEAPVGAGTFVGAPVPTLSGRVAVGSPVTADTTGWPDETTFTYAWKVVDTKGVAAFSKVTESSYAPTASTAGKKLSVVVTGTVPGFAPVARESAQQVVAVGEFTRSTPTITGGTYVGATLTANAGTWSPSTVSLRYAWKRNGTAISGATKATYKLTTADVGKRITVTVAGLATGFTTSTRTSAATAKITKPFTRAYTPTISGTAMAATTLTAKVAAWSPAAVLAYQWKRDGVPVEGATKTTYKLSASDVGAVISVSVTGTRSGYFTRTTTSAGTAVVKPPVTMLRDGMFQVGTQIAPGTYVSSLGDTCYFERRTSLSDEDWSAVLGYAFHADWGMGGPKIITIASDDAAFYTEGCGTWTRLMPTSKTKVGDGTYAVGTQIEPGAWQTTSAFDEDGCVIEFVRSFTGDPDVDIVENFGVDESSRTIVVFATDAGFTSDGCGTWTRVD